MTLKKIIPILIILFIGSFFLPVAADETGNTYDISGILRLHIRAQDNSEEEQTLKLKVRDSVLRETTRMLRGTETKQEAERILQENLEQLQTTAEHTVQEEGYDHPVSVQIKQEYFEYREYDGFFLPEGNYDALVVNIGSGEGNNWWCVVFPALCLSGVSEGEVTVDKDRIPEEFSLTDTPVPEEVPVKYDCWIFRFFKNLFS